MHVRKLVLYDVDADDDHCEKVGTIYLDLYPRLNKVAGATHFALRHSHRKFNGEYQLPVVFLNTNFAPPRSLHDKIKLQVIFSTNGFAAIGQEKSLLPET